MTKPANQRRFTRREALVQSAGLFVVGAASYIGLPGNAHGLPADKARLDRRGELWHTFSRKTENLVAQYSSTRRSSMLYEPLRNSGSMAFVGTRMIFRDHDSRGSTTRIDGGTISVVPNNQSLPPGPSAEPENSPALTWLSLRLLDIFSNISFEQLIVATRAKAPRGRTARIELAPPAGSIVRKALRQLTLTLDPVGGAVAGLSIHEAQGDTIDFEFTDHRQNVDKALLDQHFNDDGSQVKP